MTEAERMAESEAAKAALARFIAPAIKVLDASYMSMLIDAAASPLDTSGRARMEKAALAIKVLDHVKGHLQAIILDGAIARQGHDYAQQLADIPVEKRRAMGIFKI